MEIIRYAKEAQDADIAKAIGYWEDWKNRHRRTS